MLNIQSASERKQQMGVMCLINYSAHSPKENIWNVVQLTMKKNATSKCQLNVKTQSPIHINSYMLYVPDAPDSGLPF